jgi:suppressor of ftsI
VRAVRLSSSGTPRNGQSSTQIKQYHSFHIHQTPFLVTEVGGVRWDDESLHETFSVSPATDQAPGVLKVVIPFTDPVIVGRFVYHCHAVDHEDKGMIGVIEVVA